LIEDGVVAHIRRTLDRRRNHMLDTLSADEQVADVGGTEYPVETEPHPFADVDSCRFQWAKSVRPMWRIAAIVGAWRAA
jgi:hypothetical protein